MYYVTILLILKCRMKAFKGEMQCSCPEIPMYTNELCMYF